MHYGGDFVIELPEYIAIVTFSGSFKCPNLSPYCPRSLFLISSPGGVLYITLLRSDRAENAPS